MPSANEIENQNNLLLDQRDIMEEVANLFEDAAISGEMMVDNLVEARDVVREIGKEEQKQKKNKKEKLTLQQKFNNLLKDAEKQTTKVAGKLKDAAKEVSETLLDALGEIGGILSSVLSLSVVGALTGLLGTIVTNFDFAFKGVVKELGIGFNAVGSNLNKTFMSMRNDIIAMGLDFKDVIDSSRELGDNFGMALSDTAALSKDIADGAKALGVQTKTMATLVGQFSVIGNLSKEQSHLLSEQIGLLAAQNDVAPAAVLEDMAGSTEDMAVFSKGGIKNFAKTAIEARKLGMSVKDVANSLKGMLNFEDSLNKELQASVMLGRNINLNEARRLAFAGDTAGAFAAIANELGDVDLGSLDPLTLQSVADAAGMSTDQLMKMSKGADEMGGVDMGEEALSKQDVALLKARETLGEMEKVLQDAKNAAIDIATAFGGPVVAGLKKVMKLITGIDFETMGTDFNNWINSMEGKNYQEIGHDIGVKLGEYIANGIKTIGPVIVGILSALGETAGGAFLKTIGLFVAAAGRGPLAAIGKVFNFTILKPIALIGKGFEKVALKVGMLGVKFDENAKRFRKLNGQFAKVPKVQKVFDKVSKTFNKIKKIFTTMMKPIQSIGTGFFKFFKVFGKLGKGIPILGQILTVVDGIRGGINNMSEGASNFQKVFQFMGGFVIGIVEGIFDAFAMVFDTIFGTNIGKFFTDMFTEVKSIFNQLPELAMGFLRAIPEGISNFFSGLGKDIVDGISAAGDVGQMILDKVLGGLGNIGDSLLSGLKIGGDFIVDLFSDAIEGAKAVPGMIADVFKGLGTMVYDNIKAGFGKIGDFFSGIGASIANMFPSIDFQAIAADMTGGVDKALTKIKDLFTFPVNKIIDVINNIKNSISDIVIYDGYELLGKGDLIGPDDYGYSLVGNLPPIDIAIPKLKTPYLGADFQPLQSGGQITKSGLFEGHAGEVVTGVKGEALKPVADEIHSLKSDMMETNRLLARILSDGIPVTKA